MKPLAFYHLWVGDQRHGALWHKPAYEYFEALKAAEFDGEVHVGFVGGQEQRADAWRWLDLKWPAWKLATFADEGFEMPTLNALHRWCKDEDPSTPVLYCHNKGAFQSTPENHAWRRTMTGMLVDSWQARVEELAEGYDAVGLHWLTREEWPEFIKQPGIFGGNMWWARAGYIASLPPIGFHNRYCAEGWLGLNDPKVLCLKDGWPNYQDEEPVTLG